VPAHVASAKGTSAASAEGGCACRSGASTGSAAASWVVAAAIAVLARVRRGAGTRVV
jgi:hypothetical protein